jgi:hypothetical protein
MATPDRALFEVELGDQFVFATVAAELVHNIV